MEGSSREPQSPDEVAASQQGGAEARGDRMRRHGARGKLYAMAFALVLGLVALVALILANRRSVELSWVFGSTHASLVWIILAAAILVWLTGLATGTLLRRRTRRA